MLESHCIGKADMCVDTSGDSVEESFAKLKVALQANFE